MDLVNETNKEKCNSLVLYFIENAKPMYIYVCIQENGGLSGLVYGGDGGKAGSQGGV